MLSSLIFIQLIVESAAFMFLFWATIALYRHLIGVILAKHRISVPVEKQQSKFRPTRAGFLQ